MRWSAESEKRWLVIEEKGGKNEMSGPDESVGKCYDINNDDDEAKNGLLHHPRLANLISDCDGNDSGERSGSPERRHNVANEHSGAFSALFRLKKRDGESLSGEDARRRRRRRRGGGERERNIPVYSVCHSRRDWATGQTAQEAGDLVLATTGPKSKGRRSLHNVKRTRQQFKVRIIYNKTFLTPIFLRWLLQLPVGK